MNFSECIQELLNRTKQAFPYEEDLQEKILWDVLAALRAPDDHPRLKKYTTARIRGIIGMDKGLGVEVRTTPLRDQEVQVRDIMMETTSKHYKEHFLCAMEGLYILGYPVPFFERTADRLRNTFGR